MRSDSASAFRTAFSLLIALLLAPVLHAQVVIERRVGPESATAAPVPMASSVAAPTTFTPPVSGTLRIRYATLLERRPYYGSQYTDLLTHGLTVSLDGQVTTDSMVGRFAYRRGTVFSYGFQGYYRETYFTQDPPFYYNTSTRRTEFINNYSAEPTFDAGDVMAGEPFVLGLSYTEPDGGTHEMTLTPTTTGLQDGATWGLLARYTAGTTPIGPPRDQLIVYVEVIPSQVRVEVLGADLAVASSLEIARWENAYTATFGVINGAAPADNFVDLDPQRFYVRVTDSAANADPSSSEMVTARIGTTADEGTDDPTEIELVETGPDTGVFESRAQLLTTRDFPIVGEGSGPLLYTDDNYPVHDGASGPIADDDTNDRTHWTAVGGTVTASYESEGGGVQEAVATVCAGDDVRTLRYHVVSYLEPFQDIGYRDPITGATIGAGNGTFDYVGAGSGIMHSPGMVSEPYLDLSVSYLARGEDFSSVGFTSPTFFRGEEMFATDPPEAGRGPIAPPYAVDILMERADLSWEQACIRFQESAPMAIIDAPATPTSDDVHADGDFDVYDDTWYTYNALKSGLRSDVLTVVFVGPFGEYGGFQPAGLGLTPYAEQASAGIFDIQAFTDGLYSYAVIASQATDRTVAHEFGHIIPRARGHDRTEPYYFFPSFRNAPGVPAEFLLTGDRAVNAFRRLPEDLVEPSRQHPLLFPRP